MTAKAPKTVAELRAEIAKGCELAAIAFRRASREGLSSADKWAAALDRDASRNKAMSES